MEFDVVVLGTGAAGLVAALAAHDAGAKVGLFEKGPVVGGTTALSGGVAWLPLNRWAAQAGINDTRDEALAYLNSLSHGMIRPEMAEAFVDTSPDLLVWLESKTPARFQLVAGFPDYHPERPGGKPRGGRSIEPKLFPFAELGPWADRIAGNGNPMMLAETPLGGGTGFVEPSVIALRAQTKLQGTGRALVGSLVKGCLDRGIAPIVNARALELMRGGERVRAVMFRGPDGAFEVRARLGVVLATGGFEWNPDLVRSFLRGPMHHPPSIPTNEGDGLKMAMKLGAMLGNMREAWWIPVALRPGETNHGRQAVTLILRERTLPRSLMVNRKAKRFTNEAANYNALGAAFHQFDAGAFEYDNIPCWLIVDQGFVEAYGGLGAPPGELPDWVPRARSLRALGEQLGIRGMALEETVARFNGHVAEGHDPDFGRGDSAYDGWSGDQTKYPGHGATLGPLDTPPFYGIALHSSALGTKGGPLTDVNGQVLDTDGAPIAGLYAAGNAMAGATGMVYGGAGGTIGPAMVFGYRAGRHAASRV